MSDSLQIHNIDEVKIGKVAHDKKDTGEKYNFIRIRLKRQKGRDFCISVFGDNLKKQDIKQEIP